MFLAATLTALGARGRRVDQDLSRHAARVLVKDLLVFGVVDLMPSRRLLIAPGVVLFVAGRTLPLPVP